MCFSKEASYISGALLTTLGLYTVLTAKQKKMLPAALIPLFFGVQQLSEGRIWASFDENLSPIKLEFFNSIAATPGFFAALFLFFAFIIWPVWIPLSTYLPEKKPVRKTLLSFLLLAGIVTAGLAIASLKDNSITLQVIQKSIQYTPEKPLIMPLNLFIALYGATVILPSLISSIRGFPLFGVFSFAALIISFYLYYNTFTSVWCFFSAWLSIIIAMVVRSEGHLAERR